MSDAEQANRRRRRASDGVLPPLPECEKAGQYRSRRGCDQLAERLAEPAAPPEPVKDEAK